MLGLRETKRESRISERYLNASAPISRGGWILTDSHGHALRLSGAFPLIIAASSSSSSLRVPMNLRWSARDAY